MSYLGIFPAVKGAERGVRTGYAKLDPIVISIRHGFQLRRIDSKPALQGILEGINLASGTGRHKAVFHIKFPDRFPTGQDFQELSG
jgi:hypothetical protein